MDHLTRLAAGHRFGHLRCASARPGFGVLDTWGSVANEPLARATNANESDAGIGTVFVTLS